MNPKQRTQRGPADGQSREAGGAESPLVCLCFVYCNVCLCCMLCYLCILVVCSCSLLVGRGRPFWSTANLRTKILDLRGFDSSVILTLRGGILRPTGQFLDNLSQHVLVEIILVGRLGVQSVTGTWHKTWLTVLSIQSNRRSSTNQRMHFCESRHLAFIAFGPPKNRRRPRGQVPVTDTYIYIYRERERDTYIYIYIYTYIYIERER